MKKTNFRHNKIHSQTERSSEQWSSYTPTSPVSPIVLFGLFLLGVLVLLLAERTWHDDPVIRGVLEHTASAVIVAAILGFSYEHLVHQYRARTLRYLLEDHRDKLYSALKVYMLTTPAEVFKLLEEIAEQTKQTPTLYAPAREDSKGNEYTFARRIKFFDGLIDVRRKEAVEVLKDWIKPMKSINLRFLGSDFIGKYQLKELREAVRSEAIERFGQWDKLSKDEKYCTLNFMWAASRCEEQKYQWLRNLLLNSDDTLIQEWILFIPQQMPEDHEFINIIESYLKAKVRDLYSDEQKETYAECVRLAASALAALERKYPNEGRRVLIDFMDIFKSSNLDKIYAAWQDIGIPRELKPIKGLPAIKEDL
jgi:hypothetical protein